MSHALPLVARLLLAFALTYVLGFERELRGSPAGDRTFSLIGVAGAVIGLLADHVGLGGALLVVPVLGIAIAVLAPVLRPVPSERRPAPEGARG